jgi:hypothetical protein
MRRSLEFLPAFGVGVCLLPLGAVSAPAQAVKVFVFSNAGDRLTPKPDLEFQPADRPGVRSAATFHINPAIMHQKMDGLRRVDHGSRPEIGRFLCFG